MAMDERRSDLLDGMAAVMAGILEDAAPLATKASLNPQGLESLKQAGMDVQALAAAIDVIRRTAVSARNMPTTL